MITFKFLDDIIIYINQPPKNKPIPLPIYYFIDCIIVIRMKKGDHTYLAHESDSIESEINNEDIFNQKFRVEALINPVSYLPQYEQQRVYQPTCNEQCLNCCGNLCMVCAAPCGLCGCTCCAYQLPTSYAGLIETFGKFSRMLKPGLNLINPCSEEVRLVDLRLKVMSAGRHPAQTKDNVKVDIDASISYRITNPIIAHYILGFNLNRALIELTVSSLRDIIGQFTLDRVQIQRIEIADRAKQFVTKGMPAGVKVENIFVDQIIIPPTIQKDLTSAARQKRLSEANIINSKADVQAADLMRQSAELMGTKAAMQIRYLQMVQKLGQNGVLVMMDIGIDKKGYQ